MLLPSVIKEISLKQAIEDAAIWFRNRCNLFLIDDIWPTKSCVNGCVPELRNILQGSPESRIVLTTRNRNIGSFIRSEVDFGARQPNGPISISIFMLNSTLGDRTDVSSQDQSFSDVQGILNLSAGLPIALAVCGSAVASHVKMGLQFKDACSTYLKDLKQKANLGVKVLEGAIELSLEYLEKINAPVSTQFSIYDMYMNLCVLEKQLWMPVPVLAVMWEVDDKSAECIAKLFSSMSLAKTSLHKNEDGETELGLKIHDWHLNFCCQKVHFEDWRRNWYLRLFGSLRQDEAQQKKWHLRLLDGHNEITHPFVDSEYERNVTLAQRERRKCWNRNWLQPTLRNKK